MYYNLYSFNQIINENGLFRFPFIASEIFNCEINSLLDKFFDAPEPKKKSEEDSTHEEEHDEEEDEDVSFTK